MNSALVEVVKKIIGPELTAAAEAGDISKMGEIDDAIANHVQGDMSDFSDEAVAQTLSQGVAAKTDQDEIDEEEVRGDIYQGLMGAAYSLFGFGFNDDGSVYKVLDQIEKHVRPEHQSQVRAIRAGIAEGPKCLEQAMALFILQSDYPHICNLLSRCVDSKGVWLLEGLDVKG